MHGTQAQACVPFFLYTQPTRETSCHVTDAPEGDAELRVA